MSQNETRRARRPFVAQDVSNEMSYRSCSPSLRSEIVVPIFKNGEIVGELDIDSHMLAAFPEEDGVFLEEVCEAVGGVF